MNVKRIFSTNWIFLLIIPLFQPTIFFKNNYVNMLFSVWLVLVFLVLFSIFLCKKFKIDNIAWLLLFYRIILGITTYIHSGDLIKWGYYTINFISLYLLIKLSLEYNKRKLISSLVILFNIYLLINFATMIFPSLSVDGLFFLGFRTRITEYIFTLILVSYVAYENGYLKKRSFYISIIISLINVLKQWVATAILGALIVLIIFFYLSKIKKSKYTQVMVICSFILGVFLSVFIVYFQGYNLFKILVQNILHKNMTLSDRTILWENAIPIINQKIVFGYGLNCDNGNFIPYGFIKMQAHNQMLQLLYESGVIGFIVFYYFLYIAWKKLFVKKDKIMFLAIAIFTSYFVMSISEIYCYYPAYITFVILCYYLNCFEERRNVNDLL